MRSWLAVSKWVDDAAPFPGEVFRRWVRDFYQRDSLVKGMSSCAGGGWISRTSSARCSTSRASGTTSCRAPRPRPRPPSLAVWTRSQCLWTPGTWACSSGRGQGSTGPPSGLARTSLWGSYSRLILVFIDTQTNCVVSTSRWRAAARAWVGVQAERLFCARSSPQSVAAAEGLWPTTSLKSNWRREIHRVLTPL